MELKPGYKQTEVGIIPEEWTTTTLEGACIPSGLVRGPFGGTLKKDLFVKDGKKVYEQKNAIYRDAVIGSYFIDESKFRELNRFAIKPGDFIVSCSGTIGRIFRIPDEAQPGVINQALLKIVTDSDVVNSNYFYHYFDWYKFQQRIVDNTHGGAMQNLVGMSIFRKIELACPPIPEQRAIACALGDMDDLLNSLEKLIDKKRDLKQGAMQKLLTGQKRLPGFSGKWEPLNMTDNSLLKARIGWQGLTTAEYLKTGDYYLVTGTDFANGKVNWGSCYFVDESRYAQDTYIQLHLGDILFTKDGTIGKVGYVDYLPGPATLNSGVFVIRPKNQAYYPKFFYYVLTSRIFDEFLSKLQAGSTIAHLYQKDFVNFSFLAPSVPEQIAIASTLSDMDAEIAALEARLVKTRDLKQGMMQELLTGRIRLVAHEGHRDRVDGHMKEDSISSSVNHNWEFNEAVVIAALVNQFSSGKYPLGRKRYTKLSYLLHRHTEKKAVGYLKKAAGPYNPGTKYKGPEKIAQNSGYIKSMSSDEKTGFAPGVNIKKATTYFEKWYGKDVLRWIEQFRFEKNDTLELWATVDMAMQDLKKENKVITIESIKTVLLNNNEWRRKLERPIFADAKIEMAMSKCQELFGDE